MEKPGSKTKDALDNVRAAAQELHGAISDAAAKRGGAAKADLEAVSQKAKAATEFVKAAIGAQQQATKKHLEEAVTHLDAMQKHAAEGLKSSGQVFDTSIRKAVADARASVQKVSEAIAAARSAHPAVAAAVGVGVGAVLAKEAVAAAKRHAASTQPHK